MPKTQTTTTKKQNGHVPLPTAEPVTEQKPEPKCSGRYSDFAKEIRETAKRRLDSLLEHFSNSSLPEEKHVLISILENWQGRHFDTKNFTEHENYLFSAIQQELDGTLLVPVEDSEMMAEVERFITEKLSSGWKPVKEPVVCSWEIPIDEKRKRQANLLMRHVQYFCSRCAEQDMDFLGDLLEAWEGIINDKKIREGTKHHLAAASELTVEVLQRKQRERCKC